MSERPDADTGAKSAQVKTATPPAPSVPMTTEKPGTGKKSGSDYEPNKGFTGSAEYPDGYRMSRDELGNVRLADPDGRSAIWNPTLGSWIDETTGNLMPANWGADHYPDTELPGHHAHSGQ